MLFITRLNSDIVMVQHEGNFTADDSRQLRAFLREYRGKLLVDLTGTPAASCMQEICRVRSMLPQTAIIGPRISDLVCNGLPGKDYAMYEVRHFDSKADAVAWLCGECADDGVQEAAAAA